MGTILIKYDYLCHVHFVAGFPSERLIKYSTVTRNYEFSRTEIDQMSVASKQSANGSFNIANTTNIGKDVNITKHSRDELLVGTPVYRRKVVLLSTTNMGFLDFTHNLLESIRRLGALPYTVIIAEDETVYKPLLNISGVKIVQADTNSSSGKLDFRTPEYNKLVGKRPQHILNLLHQGYDVLYSDADTVWLQNPFPYFNGDEYDIFVQMDDQHVYCTGFIYYRSNNKTMELMVKMITYLMGEAYGKENDQKVFNAIQGTMKDLKLKSLNTSLFLSGENYFKEEWRREHPEAKPVMLHNNFVVGHDKKVNRFKQLGMWYV